MSGVFTVWVEGYKPPSKCPACKRVYSLIFTGKYDQHGFHVYLCGICNSFVASPTIFALCGYFHKELEEDVFYNPCVACKVRQVTPLEPICAYFKKMAYTDLKLADRVTASMVKYTETSQDGRRWSKI